MKLTFHSLSKDKCVFQTARFGVGVSYCLTSLGKNITKLESSDLVANDLLFDSNDLNGIPISCGLKKILEVGERTDICTIPPILSEKWRVLPIAKDDAFITISKYKGRVIIRELGKFPNDFCPVKMEHIQKHHPKFYSFLTDPKIISIYFSVILIWRECTFSRESGSLDRQLKFLGLVDNNTGQLKTKEACETWAETFDIPKTVTIQTYSRDLLTQSVAQYKMIRWAINDSSILSVSDSWHCNLMASSTKLDDINRLTSLWITYKNRNFDEFAVKVKNLSPSNRSLDNLHGVFKSLSFLSVRLYNAIEAIDGHSARLKYVSELPFYLQPMGWAIIRKENISNESLRAMYSNLVRIHSGQFFHPKYC